MPERALKRRPESARDRTRAPERAKKCQKGARECQGSDESAKGPQRARGQG